MKFCILTLLLLFVLTNCAPVGKTQALAGHAMRADAPDGSDPLPPSQAEPPLPTPPQPEAPLPLQTPTPPQAQAQPVSPRSSQSANLRVCSGEQVQQGVDVSNYNSKTQWNNVLKGGTDFAYIKASEGVTLGNPNFVVDWMGTKAVGVLRGAYHFFHPNDDPHKQAQFFLKEMGKLEDNDLPALFDWEDADGVSSARQIASAKIWLDDVEKATGKVPVIYVSPSYWNGLGNPQGFERYPLFIANYEVSCPYVPPPWRRWTFWQTGSQAVAGVTAARVDWDLFDGNAQDLLRFVGP